jgi:hypothetical protein
MRVRSSSRVRPWHALALFFAGACGARSDLSVSGSGGPGVPGSDASIPADGSLPADGSSPADAGPAPDAFSCPSPWIVLARGTPGPGGALTFGLYALRADGTAGHAVALDGAAMYPSTSPDGAYLLYADATVKKLSLLRFADRSVQTLPTTGTVGHGSLSPDGKLVVYGDGQDIFTVGVGGGPGQRALVPGTVAPGGTAGYPVFTRDSQTVVYAAGAVLQSIPAGGGAARTLFTIDDATNGPEFPNPALSPDLSQVAAIASCGGETAALRVYALASLPAACASGRVVATVTQRASYFDPAWGPTGLIAYSVGRDVVFVSQNGGAVTNLTAPLTQGVGLAINPTWVSGCVDLP